MKKCQSSNHVEMIRKKLDKLLSDYHGLNSPGLTCYLNSVLQVLFMTKDFREAVKGSNTAYLLLYKKVSNPAGKTVKSTKENQETMTYHHQPKGNLCSREQNLRDNFTLKKSHDDNELLKKQTCCELDQPQQRITCRHPKEGFQRSITADRFGYSLQTQMVKYNVQSKKSRDETKRDKWK